MSTLVVNVEERYNPVNLHHVKLDMPEHVQKLYDYM